METELPSRLKHNKEKTKNINKHIAKAILLGLAVGFIMLLPSFGYSQDLVSLQPSNFKDNWVRHRNGLCLIDKIAENDALAQKDASFNRVAGLSGDPNTVSFESVNYPGYYLRHENGRLKLAKNTGDKGFRADATFREVEAINGKAGKSYESVNFKGYYIRHKNSEVWVEKSDGSALFKNDATFLVFEAFPTK